jgi:hypothetical protein
VWKPHPKQLEFLNEDKPRVFYFGGSPLRAGYSWIMRYILSRHLLNNSEGREAYKNVIKGWKKSRIKKTMKMPSTNPELRRARNNILWAELQRRRHQ